MVSKLLQILLKFLQKWQYILLLANSLKKAKWQAWFVVVWVINLCLLKELLHACLLACLSVCHQIENSEILTLSLDSFGLGFGLGLGNT
jgi:hypothetical protein